VIRSLASLFGWHWKLASCGNTAEPLRVARQRHRDDALGEILRSSSCAEMTPEVLLRIL
jgi:hypothetical protein